MVEKLTLYLAPNKRIRYWPVARPSSAADTGGKGAHCLSPSTWRRVDSASLRAAGVGEPRRAPEELAPAEAGGPATANMVLGPFAETKGPRLPGRNPASPISA